MFFRLLLESFWRQRRRKLLAGVAILLGTTAVTAMLALATTIGDRIHKELAVYGANIIVTPQADTLDVKVGGVNLKPATGGAYLHEKDLEKLHGIFWANNITGISPELNATLKATIYKADEGDPSSSRHSERSEESPRLSSETATDHGFQPNSTVELRVRGLWFNHQFGSNPSPLITGAPLLNPWWKLTGSWPHGSTDVVIGSGLAKRLGLSVGSMFMYPIAHVENAQPPRPLVRQGLVSGIVSTGDATDDELLMPLEDLQDALNLPDAISRVEISARTKPEDAFAKSDPDKLSPKLRDVWYCRPYANSIAYQIREAIPGSQAEQVRRVEQSEGTVLSRISGLMWLVSAAALLAAGFAVSAAMATAILERRAEIGLMRSLGASRSVIALLFYSETGVLAILAGICGYLLGSALAAWLGARIFAGDSAASSTMHLSSALNPVLLPVVVGLAVLVAIAGSTPAIRSALSMDPSTTLRANA